jgi:hypothetical protein
MNEDLNTNGQSGQPFGHPDNQLTDLLEALLSRDVAADKAMRDKKRYLRIEDEGACPTHAEWVEFTLQPPLQSDANIYLAHAALCSKCLVVLRASHGILGQDAFPNEAAELTTVACTSSQWQHRLAADLAQTSRKPRLKNWRARFFGTGACAAAALVLLFSVVLLHRNNSPEQLLEEAYAQNRTFDLRLLGAAYAPMTPAANVRGATSYRATAPLVSARAQIEWKLRKVPSDRHLLQLKARAATLDEHYDDAIAIFDKLLASGPPTQSLLLDSSSAYFLRGTVAGDANDRAKALGYLLRAGGLGPVNPVILFNEAVIMEDLGKGADAADAWCRYLHMERDTQWQAEGRRRLEVLQQKLSQAKTNKCHWQS